MDRSISVDQKANVSSISMFHRHIHPINHFHSSSTIMVIVVIGLRECHSIRLMMRRQMAISLPLLKGHQALNHAGHPLGWNGGTCCLFNTTISVDDVTYAKMIVQLVHERVAIVSDRIYAMGWSNGGDMVERLACEAWDVSKGVASDEGAVILGNGYEDGLARWVARNGCDNVQKETYNDGKNFTNILWSNCRERTSVEFMTV